MTRYERFDTATIAAHQAALNFATTLYMPLSICMSLTILGLRGRLGTDEGCLEVRETRHQHSRYPVADHGCHPVYGRPPGCRIIFQRACRRGADPAVSAVCDLLSDLGRDRHANARGYKDVNVAFMLAFLSFWVIGLPVGYVLANYTDWQAFGYWIGLITGLAVGA